MTSWLLDMEVSRGWWSAGLLLRHRIWVGAMPRSGAANPLISLGCVVQTLTRLVGGRLDLQCRLSVDISGIGFLFDLDWQLDGFGTLQRRRRGNSEMLLFRSMDLRVDHLEACELATDVRDIRGLPAVEVARMLVEVGVLVWRDVVTPR